MMTMENIITASLWGLGIGFINSIPFGPINMTIVDQSFRRGFQPAMMIGLGALVVDIGYCVIGVFGMSALQQSLADVLQPAGMPVLVFLGYRLIITRHNGIAYHERTECSAGLLMKNFINGCIMYLCNPLAIGFWIAAAGFMYAYQFLHTSFQSQMAFVAGMAIGTAAWFFLLAEWVAVRRQTMKETTIRRIAVITGWVLIVSGFILGWRYVSYKGWIA